MPVDYVLVTDDPAMYLDDRGNPRHGRRLIYRGGEDAVYELMVTDTEYANPETIKKRLAALVASHTALKSISL